MENNSFNFFYLFHRKEERRSMASQINVQPDVLDLALYAGDGVSIRLLCTNSSGAPIDVTGTVKAQVRLAPITEDPPIVEFAADMVDAYLGIVVLSLTGEQTQELSDHPSSTAGKFVGVWDIQWEPAGLEPRTLSQGRVECVSDVTR
jgi:hypothetical protein